MVDKRKLSLNRERPDNIYRQNSREPKGYPRYPNLNRMFNGLNQGGGAVLGFTNGSVDLNSSLVIGSLTADYISVTQLSAISSSLGTVTIGTSGSLSSGQTAYNTGIGYWFEYNGGSPRASMGNPAGSHWTWDGAAFKIYNGAGTLVFDSNGLNATGVNFDQDGVPDGATYYRSTLNAAGTNLMPIAYSLFGVNRILPIFDTASGLTPSLSAAANIYGYPRMNLTFAGTSNPSMYLNSNHAIPNLHLLPAKYIVSVYMVNVSSNNNSFSFSFRLYDSTNTLIVSSNTVAPYGHAANTAGVYYATLDLTGQSGITDCSLRMNWSATPTAGVAAIQGIQLEMMNGNNTSPSSYTVPTYALADVTGCNMSPFGSIPPISPNMTFSYSSTLTSITWSWPTFTIYRPDGSSASQNTGTQGITGLPSGSTNYFYPYYDEVNTGIGWITGTRGTPALAFAAKAAVAVAAQNNLGLLPLSNGAIVGVCASGGSGGGGGTACLWENQTVYTKRGNIAASKIHAGDFVMCRSGWTEVISSHNKKWSEWIEVTFNNGHKCVVTPSEPFAKPDGNLVIASALMLEDVVNGQHGLLSVSALRKIKKNSSLVRLDVGEPHLFYIQKGGAEVHNGTVKP